MTDDLPEWLILTGEIRHLAERMRADVAAAVERFNRFDDVRDAISHRTRMIPELENKVAEVNKLIARLNLIAPAMRFQQMALDPAEEVAPMARSYFQRPR